MSILPRSPLQCALEKIPKRTEEVQVKKLLGLMFQTILSPTNVNKLINAGIVDSYEARPSGGTLRRVVEPADARTFARIKIGDTFEGGTVLAKGCVRVDKVPRNKIFLG